MYVIYDNDAEVIYKGRDEAKALQEFAWATYVDIDPILVWDERE